MRFESPGPTGHRRFAWGRDMRNSRLIGYGLLALSVMGCQGDVGGMTVRREGLNGEAVAKKRFDDDSFLCTALAEGDQRADGEEGGPDDDAGGEGGGEATTLSLTADPAVSYDGRIKALLAAKCVACHKPGGTPPDVSTYDAAKASGEDNLRTILDGSMPPAGALPKADQDAFKAWVDGGYLKGAPGGAGGAASGAAKGGGADATARDLCGGEGDAVGTKPAGGNAPKPAPKAPAPKGPAAPGGGSAPKATFTGGIKSLLDSKCNACHKAGGTPPDLTTYALAKAEGASSLATIEDGSMPPGKPLPDDQKALFKNWVDAGYPEN